MNVLRLRLRYVSKRLLDLRLRHKLRARVLLLRLGWIAYLGAVRIHARRLWVSNMHYNRLRRLGDGKCRILEF